MGGTFPPFAIQSVIWHTKNGNAPTVRTDRNETIHHGGFHIIAFPRAAINSHIIQSGTATVARTVKVLRDLIPFHIFYVRVLRKFLVLIWIGWNSLTNPHRNSPKGWGKLSLIMRVVCYHVIGQKETEFS